MTWKPGDKPDTHPLWQLQIQTEWDMAQRGADKFAKRLAKARDREDLSRIPTFRRLVQTLTADTMLGLQHWLNGVAKQRRGGKPMAFQYLKMVDPAVASYIAVRTTLDNHGSYGDGSARASLTSLAQSVGLEAEQQARMQAWTSTKEGRALFSTIQKDLTKQKATSKHRKRVNLNRFNTIVADEIQWHPWSRDVRLQVGLKLIDVMCRATGHQFQVIPDPQHNDPAVPAWAKGKSKAYIKPRYIVQASDDIVQFLLEGIEADAYRQPEYLPTVMPPKPWTSMRDGGYYTKAVKKPPLIRFKTHSEETQGVAMEEFDALDMPRVYSAVNIVQEVPWRVNKRILKVAWECWERGVAVKNLARRTAPELPPRPQAFQDLTAAYPKGRMLKAAQEAWIKDHEQEWKLWKRSAAKVYGEQARLVSTTRSTISTLALADRFSDQEIYFPHMLDFRGRMYPIPIYLQPQGNDLARGLLTFAHGRAIGEHGGFWLAVNVANTWGNDKIPFQERVDWVTSKWDLWCRIAEEPMKNLEWTTASKPWQCLAGIIEFVAKAQGDAGGVSSLPVHVDGTCNGIQHLSALMHDEVGGASVNLYPSDHPRDIYKEVADVLQDGLEIVEDSGGAPGHMASMWLDALDRDIPRDFTKRQVMVLPYGGSKEAFYKYTHEWLQEKEDAEGVERIPKDDKRLAVPYMRDRLWDAVKAKVVSGMACMEWLKECAGALAETNQPIVWKTPSGFMVRHFYGQVHERRVKTLFDGQSIWLNLYERTKDLAPKEQLQGIAPNFVHSLDGSANMETAIAFAVETHGAPFTTIHDSFGTTAGDMWRLHDILRYAFVKVHSVDMLEEFRQQCVTILRDKIMATQTGTTLDRAWETANDIIPPVPERGSLDIKEVLHADYFFA